MASTSKNIYEQQALNKRLTLVVFAGFILFVGFLGFGLDVFLFDYGPWDEDGGFGLFPFPIATLAAVSLGGIGAARSAAGGDAAVLASATAVPVGEDDPK
jgi:hypothetical protein